MFINYLDSNQITFVDSLVRCIKNRTPFLIGTGHLQANKYLPLRLKDDSGNLNNGDEYYDNTYWISTSGTTGLPKYFGITFDSLYETVEALDSELRITQNDIEMIFAPVKYSFGLARLASAVIGDREYIIAKNLTDLRWLNKNKDKPLSMGLNPYMLKVWFDSFESYFRGTNFKSIKLESGSMPLFNSLVEQAIELINPKHWVHHYGMTEASRIAFKQIVPTTTVYQSSEIGIIRESIELNLEGDKPVLKGSNMAKFQLVHNKVLELQQIVLNDVFEVHADSISIVGRIDNLVKYKGSFINLSLIATSILNNYGLYSKIILENFEIYVILDSRYIDALNIQEKIQKFVKQEFGIDSKIFYEELIFTETGKIK